MGFTKSRANDTQLGGSWAADSKLKNTFFFMAYEFWIQPIHSGSKHGCVVAQGAVGDFSEVNLCNDRHWHRAHSEQEVGVPGKTVPL